MLKRLSLVLLALCLLFGFAACGSAPAHESEPKPENWDMEAEVLRFLNGMNTAKTVEELRPYVLSENPDRLLEKYIAETNKILEETWQYSDVKLDYRDYTYDSVRVTVLDTYKGYDILWVHAVSSSFIMAWNDLSAMKGAVSAVGLPTTYLIPLTIENGHYVTSMDETLPKEIHRKYDYCDNCYGSGYEIQESFICEDCNGAGRFGNCVCNDCGNAFQVELPPNTSGHIVNEQPITEGGLVGFATQRICPACESENVTLTEEPCSSCAAEGFILIEPEKCRTCDGNGWIKK